jgi:glycosyltransferase involved in cell wall biosynthesis
MTYWSFERRRIHRQLDEIQPDVVHIQGVGGWGLGCRYPAVLTLHGLAEETTRFSAAPLARFRSAVMGTIERRARRAFPHVISISPYLVEKIGNQIRGRIWRIENPISDEYFQVQRTDGGRSILFLGRISRLKNVLGAIRALARLPKGSAARLRVGGDAQEPAYAAECRRVAGELGVSDRIDWLGSLGVGEVKRELSQAACLLLSSLQETAPLVIQEAMAVGVPVVASNLCGIPYLVSHGRTGFLVDPTDSFAIAQAVRLLLDSPELRSSMGSAARAEAERRFRAARVAQETIAVYETAAGLRP